MGTWNKIESGITPAENKIEFDTESLGKFALKVSGARLPEAYQEVEYLVSKGGTATYLITDIAANVNKVQIKTKLMDTSTSRTRYGYHMFFAVSAGLSGAWGREVLNFNVQSDLATGSSCNASWFSPLYNLNTAYEWNATNINGSTATLYRDTDLIGTATQKSISSTNVFYLFGHNYGGNPHSTYAPCYTGRCYYIQAWVNDELHYDLVPCYRKSDNISGMYDLVSNTFLTSSGSAQFEVGPEV